MGQRDFIAWVVIKMTAAKVARGMWKGFPSSMDQTNKEPTVEKPSPKKTLREIYANAASGLLLMMSEEEVSREEDELKSDEAG